MISRTTLCAVAGAVVLALGTAGCSTFSDNDAAVVVNGDEVSRGEMARLVDQLVESKQYPLLTPGVVDGTNAAGLASALVQRSAYRQFLAAGGQQVSADDTTAATQNLSADAQGAPTELRNLIVELTAQPIAAQRIPSPSTQVQAQLYATRPARLGLVCARLIQVATNEDAERAAARVRAGEDVAAVAMEVSTEPGSAAAGGALANGDVPCVPLDAVAQNLDPALVRAILGARPGQLVGPVSTTAGWDLVYLRPYDEVSDAIAGYMSDTPGQLLFAGFLATADVRIDPAYGVWDAALPRVVAPGSPGAAP